MPSFASIVRDWLLVPKVLYFTMNLAYYSCYTFRPKYLRLAYGIETKHYGLIASLLSLISFFAGYGWAYAVDRWQRPKLILLLTTILSAGVFQFLLVPKESLGDDFVILWATLVSAFYITFVSAMIPILDARMLKWLMEQPNATKEMYGRQRLWGTIAYACTSVFVGSFPLIPTVNISIGAFSTVFVLAVHFFLPNDQPMKRDDPTTDKKQSGDGSSPMYRLLTNFNFMFLLLVVLMNGLARAVMTHFLEPVQRMVYKTPQSATGWSTVTGVLFEIVVFFFSKRLLQYFGERKMLLLAQLAMIARVSCYAFIPRTFEGVQYAPIFYELFKGLNFGFMHSAGVQMATNIAPSELKATAQSLFSGVYSGLAAAIAGVFGYLIFELNTHLDVVNVCDTMLQLTAYLSIFALVIFIMKYIVYDEYLTKKSEKNFGTSAHKMTIIKSNSNE